MDQLQLTLLPVSKLIDFEDFFDSAVEPLPQHHFDIPLCVIPQQNSFLVIDGCKRLQSIRSLKRDSYPCIIYADVTTLHNAGFLRVALNAHRSFTLSEKLIFTKWLKANYSEQEYLAQCVHLQISDHERHNLEQLHQAAPEVLSLVKIGHLYPEFVPELNRVSKNNTAEILQLFTLFCFSKQTQRELLEWLPEISWREHITIKDLLGLPEMQTIYSSTTLNTPQKIQKIRDLFFAKRYPVLQDMQKSWKSTAARINPAPGAISFTPSAFFEKDRLEIKISVKTADQLKNIIEKLAGVPLEQWKQLIHPSGLSEKI